jgi:hypothetical protein
MKLSPDSKTLAVWVEIKGPEDKENIEMTKLFDLASLKKVCEEALDLEDNPEHKEDPKKLMFFNYESNYIYLRHDSKKGIKLHSVEDGSKLGEVKLMHTNPILQILVTKDGKYIVTSGKDKKIKVYDWNNE